MKSLGIVILLTVLPVLSNNILAHNPNEKSVSDIDGNVYSIVKIGDQMWMGEDLRTTHFNDGSPILHVVSASKWEDLNKPAYSWYKNDEEFKNSNYGALYNWYTAADDRLCPVGWRVPNSSDWDKLSSYLGVGGGGKLKESGLKHWLSTSVGDTNETGFTALPGGSRQADGSFEAMGDWGNWWSSSETSKTNAMYVFLFRASTTLGIFDTVKDVGFSVRCIKE
ncbi:fibrobacter succinogenes major paralogous domain-containing protein [Marinilabiliaceae bacterium ANBcel2]|nr:fibrobacter succinogenes major paralogous domain-containing protein [Marinilabiliaceae bacterium ANBcel2]